LTAEQRLLVLDAWQRSGLPARDFAPLVGMSRHTLYAWKKKFDTEGPAGLMDKPRGGPQGSRLPDLTKRTILMLKQSNPDWGVERVSAMSSRYGPRYLALRGRRGSQAPGQPDDSTWGLQGPTPEEVWRQRQPFTARARPWLAKKVCRLERESRQSEGHSAEGVLLPSVQASVERVAISRALACHGYLQFSRPVQIEASD